MKKFVSVALILVMMFALAVSAAADTSPTGAGYYSITVLVDGKGSASSDKNKVSVDAVGEDSYVTLTAVDGEETFVNWTFEGSFNVISGSADERIMVIQPTSDIIATAHFKGQGATEIVTPTQKPNNGNTSPKTGDPTMMIIAMMMLALGVSVFAVKKIRAK